MPERDDDARQGGKRAGDQERGAGSRRAGGRRGEQARSERQPRTRERQVQAGRSDVYDEPPLEPRPKRTTDPSPAPGRGPQRSRHTLQDDEVPDVRFGCNVGDAGSEASEGNLSDFTDETSAGHHAGYGDYGQQDYGPHGEKVPGGENPGRPHQRKPDKRAVPAESGSAEGESAEGESAEREKADPDTQGAVGRATPKTG